MPTYYDPVEMEDIDIRDEQVNFYLLGMDNNRVFKVCATTQDMNAGHMKFDPETRIKEYWPITRDQLYQADLKILFPEDSNNDRKLRSEPFTLEELNTTFKFNSPFTPDNSQLIRFGLIPNNNNYSQELTQTLSNEVVAPLIESGVLNISLVRSRSREEIMELAGTLSNEVVAPLIESRVLNVFLVSRLSREEAMELAGTLSNEVVAPLIESGVLNISLVRSLSREETIELAGTLSNEVVAPLIESGVLNVFLVSHLSREEAMELAGTLSNEVVAPLIESGVLNISLVRSLSREETMELAGTLSNSSNDSSRLNP